MISPVSSSSSGTCSPPPSPRSGNAHSGKNKSIANHSTSKRPAESAYIDHLLGQSISGSGLPQFLRKKISFREATHSESLKGLVTTKSSGNNIENSTSPAFVSYKAPGVKTNTINNTTTTTIPSAKGQSKRDAKFGFKAPEMDLFPLERLEPFLRWSRVRSIGPGLSNMGNTCFLNSVLQCLFYTTPLAEFLLSREHSKRCHASRDEFCGLCVMERLLFKVHQRQEEAVLRPLELVSRLKAIGKHFRPGRQEDSHEFLRLFIETMQKASLPSSESLKLDVRSKETSLVHRIFGGHLQSTVTCASCKHVSRTFDQFLDLSLDINKADSLAAAFKVFTTPELLSKGNKYRCEACHRTVEAHKQFSIYKTPEIFTVQLKRFSVNPFTGQTGKVNRPVSFTENLDISEWISKGPEGHTEGCLYRLYAVIVHEGNSCNSGHYHAFVRNSNDIWYSMNDSSVHQVGLETVLRQRAYILFYQKQSNRSTGNSNNNAKTEQNVQVKTTTAAATTKRTMEEKMIAVREASLAYTSSLPQASKHVTKQTVESTTKHTESTSKHTESTTKHTESTSMHTETNTKHNEAITKKTSLQTEPINTEPVPLLVNATMDTTRLRSSSMWHMSVVNPEALNHPTTACKRIKSNFYNSWRVDKI